MSLGAWISLIVTLGVFVALQLRRTAPADLLFMGGLVTVTALGVIEPSRAFQGFANPAVIMVGALFVVAAGLRHTGALDLVGRWILGGAETDAAAVRRLTLPTVGLSALMNNTPIVAMLVPILLDWCRSRGLSPSRVLLPISYLAIMGGTCTLIGTSTNLVVHGMLVQEQQRVGADDPRYGQLRGMHLFEIGCIGLPCAVMGTLYLIAFGRRLLPDRTELIERLGDQRREYLVEMQVRPECRLIGRTIEDAGLRHLPGLHLIEIDRDGDVITPVSPTQTLRAGDRLIFTGVVTTIVDLEKIPGLQPVADTDYDHEPGIRQRRRLTEAVLSSTSPLIGRNVREANFRSHYNAAVVAVHRNGEQVRTKIGDIRLEPGDTLLLQTTTDFVASWRNSPEFYLVSSVEGSRARRHDRVWQAFTLLGLLVVLLLLSPWLSDSGTPAEELGFWDHVLRGIGSPAVAALGVAVLMVICRCLPLAEARSSVELTVLVTIGAALGLGAALDASGAAAAIAGALVRGLDNPHVLLAVIFVLTLLLTEMITNTAVAAVMFPIVVQVAVLIDVSPRPFVMAVALAASSSFISPIGYQTNLMVMGPGGYRPADYLKAGLPLSAIISVTAVVLIPWIWPF